MRTATSILAVLALVVSSALPAQERPAPKFGWVLFSKTSYSIAERESTEIGLPGPGTILFNITSSAAMNIWARAGNWIGCKAARVTELQRACALPAPATLVVQDTGDRVIMKGWPNRVTVELSEWRCIENCP